MTNKPAILMDYQTCICVSVKLWVSSAWPAFLVSTDTERWPEYCSCFSVSKLFGVSGGKTEAQRNSRSSRQLIFISHFCFTGAGQASKRSQLGFNALHTVAEMS